MQVLVVQPTANSTTFAWEQGFEELGHDVTVLTATGKLQFGGRPGAVIHPLPNTDWSRRLASRSRLFHRHVNELPAPRRVRATLRALAPDVALVKSADLRTMLIAREIDRLGIPWLLWQEQLPPLSRRWELLARLGTRPVAAFTALDSRPGGVAAVEPESALPRISYGPYRHSDRRGRERDDERSGPLRVLVVASFKNHVAKHQWAVLEAAAEAGLLDGSVRFTFSGQGGPHHRGYQRVEELVRRHGIEDAVTILTDVPFEEMPDLYRSHDVLVLPSVREQFGMAVVEAMAHGLPTIVSDAVGAIGCVVPEETGLIHPVSDIDALGRALRRLVDEPGLRERLGHGATTFVQQHLTGRILAARILALLPG